MTDIVEPHRVQTESIRVHRTARIATLGGTANDVREFWYVLHGYGGGYLPPILGSKSRPAGPLPQEPFRAGQTVVIQPNVVTPDGKAGVQTGEMVVITEPGIERLHSIPRGFIQISSASS